MNRSIGFILVAAVAAGAGLVLGQRYFSAPPSPSPSPAASTPAPALQAVTLIEPARVVADFSLLAADGGTLAPAALRGRWTVVFLGFTHCPDVCPTTLTDLARAQKDWEPLPLARRPRVLFVSVDPDRDTPAKTGEYARYFHPETLGATGQEPALTEFARTLGLVYMKVPSESSGSSGDYSMDHSSTLVLLDPQGRLAGLIRPPLKPEALAADLRLLAETRP